MSADTGSINIEKWRAKFRRRFLGSVSRLLRPEALGPSERQRCHSFRRYVSENRKFEQEVLRLSQFEIEALAITSTTPELKKGAAHFSADEVTDIFRFRVDQKRRTEVKRLLNSKLYPVQGYNSAGLDHETETTRIQSIIEFIKHTLSRSAALQLCSQLVEELGWVSTSKPDGSLSLDRFTKPISDLAPDAFDVLSIIHAAGGKVPSHFAQAALGWNEHGSLVPVEVPAMEVLTVKMRWETALTQLLQRKHILLSDVRGLLVINPNIVSHLQDTQKWRRAALEAVCRAFPRYPEQSTCFTEASDMIPPLVTVLAYLPDVPLDGLQVAVPEVCLSASYFGLLPWKQQMLETAFSIGRDDPLLLFRLNLRDRMIKRLASPGVLPTQPLVEPRDTIRPSRRANGYMGSQVVFEMKLLLEKDAPVHEMTQCFSKFQPIPGAMSTQERHVLMAGQGALARAYRNQGEFGRASHLYSQMIEQHTSADPTISPSNGLWANHAETLCETMQTSTAITELESELKFRRTGIGMRLQLALAHAWLMSSLIHFQSTGRLEQEQLLQLSDASCLYSHCLHKRRPWQNAGLTKINRYYNYIATASLAITEHVGSFVHDQHSTREQIAELTQVRETWRRARAAALECWSAEGFAVMITYYSESEVAYRLGSPDAYALHTSAMEIFGRTGRQYHFPAQGTIWLDILESKVPGEPQEGSRWN